MTSSAPHLSSFAGHGKSGKGAKGAKGGAKGGAIGGAIGAGWKRITSSCRSILREDFTL